MRKTSAELCSSDSSSLEHGIAKSMVSLYKNSIPIQARERSPYISRVYVSRLLVSFLSSFSLLLMYSSKRYLLKYLHRLRTGVYLQFFSWRAMTLPHVRSLFISREFIATSLDRSAVLALLSWRQLPFLWKMSLMVKVP